MIEATCAACGTVARIAEADVPVGAKFVTCASCKSRVALPQQKAATPAKGVKSVAIPAIGKPPPIPGPAKGRGETVDLADLPAPKRANPLAGASGPSKPVASALSSADLPAPKSAKPPAPAPGALDLDDLMPPAPKSKSDAGLADLPAPKARPSPLAGASAPSRPTPSPLADLPSPKTASALADLPAPKAKPAALADLPSPKAKPDLADLPAPKGKPATPAAKPAAAAATSSFDDEVDLPMPKPGANNDLPAPKGFFDDLPQPAKPRDGGGIDLPAPKGFFDDLPQPAKPAGGKPGQELTPKGGGSTDVAPKGFFDDLPQPAKQAGGKPGQELTPKAGSTDVAPKGFFDDLPQPAKGGGKGGLFDDLPQPTKGAVAGGLFDDLPQPSTSSDGISLDGGELDLGRPLELDGGGGSPDLDLGLPLGEAGGFQDLDLGEPTKPKPRGSVPEEPASPIKIKTPGKGGASAKPIQINVPKAAGSDLKLDLAEDPHGAPAAVAKGRAAAKGKAKQTPEELAEARAASRRRTRIVLGTVVTLAALGAGGFYGYKRHVAKKEREEAIHTGIEASRKALVDDKPNHWNAALAQATDVIEKDSTNTVALGLAAEASLAGALDTGINGPARIRAGRDFLQKGLGAGKATNELERAQALAYIANNQPEKAIPKLKTLIAQGNDGWLQLYLGWAELDLGDATEALKAFDQAVAKSKQTKLPALYGHGSAKLMLADIDGARTDFETILQAVKADSPQSVCPQVQLYATMPPSKSAERDANLKSVLERKDVVAKQVDPRCVTQVYTLLGDVARQNGRLDIARENYRKAIALTADDVGALVGLARVEMRDSKLQVAAESVTKALAANSNDPRAQLVNGELFVMQGKLPDAQKQIDTLSARKPPLVPLDQAQLQVLKGKLLEVQGKPEDAVVAYSEGAKLAGELDLTPTMAAVTLLTNLAKKTDDPAKSEAYKAQASELLSALAARAQEDAQLSAQLGVAYLQAGDAAKAETFLQRAVAMKDDDPEFKLELGKALSALGRTDEALQQINGAIKIDPKRTDFQLELAVTYQNAGRDKDAITAYEKLLGMPEVPQVVRENAGRYFVRKGLLDRDEELIKKGAAQSEPILKAEPENAAGLYLKGEGLMLNKKYDDAGPILTKASDLDPEAQYLDALGRDYEMRIDNDTKFVEGARNAYERAARADPKLLHALVGEGRMLVKKNEYAAAITPLIAAKAIDASDSGVRYWLAMAYYGLRNTSKDYAKGGAEFFEAALTSQPELSTLDKANGLYRLGDLYDKYLNDAKKTASTWERALSTADQVEKELGAAADDKLPWRVETYYYLGDTYYKLNDPADERRAFLKYLDHKPKDNTHVQAVNNALATRLQRSLRAVAEYAAAVFERLGKLRTRLDRAVFFGNVLRASKVVQPMRPAAFAQFVKGARQTKVGPHLAIMFHAASHPDKEAVVEYGEHGVRRLTWGEFDATINRLAHALVARGVRGGSRVALMLPNGSEYLIAQQALARLGATAVQIGYRLKPGEIAYILENSNPTATVVHGEYVDAMKDARKQAGGKGGPAGGKMIVCGADVAPGDAEMEDWDRALAAASPEVPPRVRGGDGGGVIVYTSGTTGKPKGANRAWRKTGFESVADMILQVGMRSDDRHLVTCPLYHSAAPAFVAIMMSLGATVVLQNHFEPEAALDIIQKERITCSLMVPTMLIRMTNLPAETLRKYNTSSLRWVMSAAAPLTTEAARRFMDTFGPVLWNFYGATETGLVTLAGPHDHVSRPGTIGKRLRGNEIRLLDDSGRDVPVGQVGELYARNPTLISGYHGNDDATKSSQRDGFFSVGDVGRIDAQGYYYLESRKHDMVISGGVNIYPREIEDHLSTHPAILEAAVIGVPDPEWGETLRAFIVLRTGQQLSEVDVINYCREALADYKRPRKVTFMLELPRNPTGKILKRELRELQ